MTYTKHHPRECGCRPPGAPPGGFLVAGELGGGGVDAAYAASSQHSVSWWRYWRLR